MKLLEVISRAPYLENQLKVLEMRQRNQCSMLEDHSEVEVEAAQAAISSRLTEDSEEVEVLKIEVDLEVEEEVRESILDLRKKISKNVQTLEEVVTEVVEDEEVMEVTAQTTTEGEMRARQKWEFRRIWQLEVLKL